MLLSLEIDDTDIEHARERVMEQGHGREPAICELRCDNCGEGIKFDDPTCITCGLTNPRFRDVTGPRLPFDASLPVAKSIP